MEIRDHETELSRDRGVLTKSDRAYLSGENDLEGESERQARQRIRERIKNSIRDFWFIRYCLSEKDRKLIADELWGSDGPLWQGYIDMNAFFYRLHVEEGFTMKSDLRNAIESEEDRMAKESGHSIDLDFTFEIEKTVVQSHSDLHEKFEDNQPMTPEEVQTLIFDSQYFQHLNAERKWKKFQEFLNGDLEVECVVEEDDDWVKPL